MSHHIIPYKDSKISFYHYGSGPHTVICFHGYGEDGSAFGFMEQEEWYEFQFFAIDLPFHGKTIWNEGPEFGNEDLHVIIELMLFSVHPDPVSALPFHLMGFSLGGRVALSLYQSQPSKFDKVVLLAPDGLKVNNWYWLATQTRSGNKLFSYTMDHPGWFFSLLKVFNKLGIVNSSIFKFVNYYIGNLPARKLLYQRWIGMRKLRPNLRRIQSFILKHQTLVRVVYGKHDRIILKVVGDKFRKGIEENCRIIKIESGHQVLHPKHAVDILSALRH